MNCSVNILKKTCPVILFCLVLCTHVAYGQEANSDLSLNSPFQNQLFFNRFLINPTFSLVRENKSYLNVLHRNQYASFEDNFQNYYLGFSNRLNDNTALGISIYGQWAGVMQEFGFNANYATSVQLGLQSRLTFGTNITYLSQGLNKNSIIATENDPALLEARKENKVSVQPGITLSLGKFDFGLYATDLFKYNQTTNNLITTLNDKSIKTSLQYTHTFSAQRGLFANARLMPLFQLSKNEDASLYYVGSVVLDLPEYGWVQTTLDDTYGWSLGLGFKLNKKLSLGYLLEKDFSQAGDNLGWNHEISMAYTFKDQSYDSGDYVDNSMDNKIDEIVKNYEDQILLLIADKNTKTEDPNTLAYQNRLILDELILRQDSVETARNEMFEKRFEIIVRLLRNEKKQNPEDNLKKSNNNMHKTAVADIEHNKSSSLKTVAQKDIQLPKHKDYIELPIRSRNRSDVMGVESGYYLIANVYKNKRYLNTFINNLNEQGLNAKQFYNKENGLYYVYLADFKMKNDARTAFVSNLNGKYQDEKWIMQVYNSQATAEVVYEDL